MPSGLNKNRMKTTIKNSLESWISSNTESVERGQSVTGYDSSGNPIYEPITGDDPPEIDEKLDKLVELVIDEVVRAVLEDLSISIKYAMDGAEVSATAVSGSVGMYALTKPEVQVSPAGNSNQANTITLT